MSATNPTDYEKQGSIDEKNAVKDVDIVDADESSSFGVLEDERDIATHVITVTDDPTLNPWTVRSFVIGIGLSAFGGVLGELLLSICPR